MSNVRTTCPNTPEPFQQPARLTGVEFVLDLAHFTGGFRLRFFIRIDRETATEDAFHHGEFVAAPVAFRLRGIQLRQGDLAERFVFVGTPGEQGLRGAVKAVNVEFRRAVGIDVGDLDPGDDAADVHFDGPVVFFEPRGGDGEAVAAAGVGAEYLESDILQCLLFVERWRGFRKEEFIAFLNLGGRFAGRGWVGLAIELQRREPRFRAASADADQQVPESVVDGFSGVDRLVDDLDRSERFEAVGRALEHEHGRPAAAHVAALAVHQREHVFLAVGVEVGAGDVVVVGLDVRIDLLQCGLGEGKDWRRGVCEAGSEEEGQDRGFHGIGVKDARVRAFFQGTR
jgi:hypothetical protein